MGGRWKRTLLCGACPALVALVAAGLALPQPAGGASSPWSVALIASTTGPAASQFADAPQGFLARIDLQNARGGVDGRRIVPMVLNDNTDPTQAATAAQEAISRGAVGIVAASPVFFAADKYPEQAGIPVTGASVDGPEWGERPFTNMFASDVGSLDPTYPAGTELGSFLVHHGGRVIATYGYGIAPLSAHSAETAAQSFDHAGGRTGVLDTSVPFGAVDFTTAALVAKTKGVDAVYAGLQNDSNVALLAALQQAGVKLKAALFPTGFEPGLVGTPAWRYLVGAYFLAEFRPFQLPDAATATMAAALRRYAHRPPSDFADFGVYEGWLGADLMIKGLELAGAHPTPARVITALRHLRAYDGGGLLPETIDYATVFGKGPVPACDWYMRAEPKGFVPVSSRPFCGRPIPGTGLKS
ncbi:MAG: ABC transporter substrate-binding protein [Acidimicrobiales bacterium]